MSGAPVFETPAFNAAYEAAVSRIAPDGAEAPSDIPVKSVLIAMIEDADLAEQDILNLFSQMVVFHEKFPWINPAKPLVIT